MLIKQISKELTQDSEFAPNIVEPLKIQDVEPFGDYGIQICPKMTIEPGD